MPEPHRDPAEGIHGPKAHNSADPLLLQVTGGDGVAGVVLALGGAGGIEHGQSHRQQQEHQNQEGIINRVPRRVSAAVLFGMEPLLHCQTSVIEISRSGRKCRTRRECT